MDRITVSVDERDVTLYFGMVAKRIWQTKCKEEVARLSGGKKPKAKEVQDKASNERFFAFLIYAGMYNQAESMEVPVYPTFEDAFTIADGIISDEAMTLKVWACWEESKPNQQLVKELEALTGGVKKKEVKKG